MEHDPLCPCFEDCEPNDVLNAGDDPQHEFMSQYGNECIQCLEECHCEIMAKVRADERERSARFLESYAEALRHLDSDYSAACRQVMGAETTVDQFYVVQIGIRHAAAMLREESSDE